MRTRDSFPMQWAASQLNLGNALNNVGKLEAGTASLELGSDRLSRRAHRLHA